MKASTKYNVLYKGQIVQGEFHVNAYDYRVWKLDRIYLGCLADEKVIVLPTT